MMRGHRGHLRCAGDEGACGKAAGGAPRQCSHVAAWEGVGAGLGRLEQRAGLQCHAGKREEGLIRSDPPPGVSGRA